VIRLPYLKPIKGRTSVRPVRDYLLRGGRALAEDLVNLCERDASGADWAQQMDATRRLCGTDAGRGGRRARTYNHYVLSPDPADGVSLEELRAFVTEFLDRAFEGRFQVAVVYHDDSASRLAAGQEGILHAHLVVNNANIVDGGRLAPWLTPSRVRRIDALCQSMADERGWGSFSAKAAKDAEAARAGRRGFAGMSLDGERSEAARAPYSSARADAATLPERALRAAGSWSWKDDLRARARVAMALSGSEAEYLEALGALDVRVAAGSSGEWVYAHPDDPGRWRASGARLGPPFSRAGARSALAARSALRPADRARALSALSAWRVTGIRTVGWVEPSSGVTLADVADALECAARHGIGDGQGWATAAAKAEGTAEEGRLRRAAEVSAVLDRLAAAAPTPGRDARPPVPPRNAAAAARGARERAEGAARAARNAAERQARSQGRTGAPAPGAAPRRRG